MKKLTFETIIKDFDTFLIKNNLPQDKIWVRAGHVHLIDSSGGDNWGAGLLHLYLPEKPVTLQKIEKLYNDATLLPDAPLVFYVIALHNNKTVCGLLGDWFDFNDPSPGLELHHDNTIIFSCDDKWDTFTLVDNPTDWANIKDQPKRLSNLDYLFK